MKSLIFLVLLLLISVFAVKAQYSPNEFNLDLQTGDLLFCSSTSGALSKAIDQATQMGKETHFDHIGIVETQNDTVGSIIIKNSEYRFPKENPAVIPMGWRLRKNWRW